MTIAARIHAAKDLRLEEETAAELGPHDVELRLGAGGICGSDLHYFQHGRVGAFQMREPLIPGHEASGVVARLGPAVTRVKVGDKVAINPSHPCGRCDYCNGGRLNLCRNMRFLGSASVFPHVQGMFRERFVMGEAQLTPIARVADQMLTERYRQAQDHHQPGPRGGVLLQRSQQCISLRPAGRLTQSLEQREGLIRVRCRGGGRDDRRLRIEAGHTFDHGSRPSGVSEPHPCQPAGGGAHGAHQSNGR